MVRRRPSAYGYALVDEASRWQGPEGVAPAPRAVYKALRDLSAAHLIEPLEVAADQRLDGPNRRRFIATSEGERRFVEWLRMPPETFTDLFRRIATARREDLPMLLEHVIAAEHVLLAQQRDLRVPEIETLLARRASWESISAAFLEVAEWIEVAPRATFLRDLRRTLTDLIDHSKDTSALS
jgi:DNA-binding PadR family transcriptional regulator